MVLGFFFLPRLAEYGFTVQFGQLAFKTVLILFFSHKLTRTLDLRLCLRYFLSEWDLTVNDRIGNLPSLIAHSELTFHVPSEAKAFR